LKTEAEYLKLKIAWLKRRAAPISPGAEYDRLRDEIKTPDRKPIEMSPLSPLSHLS